MSFLSRFRIYPPLRNKSQPRRFFYQPHPMKNIIFLYTTVLFSLSAHSQTSDQLYSESLKSFNDKDFDHALRSVEKSIQADSGNGKAYYLRGLIYFNANQFKQAIPDFDKIIELKLDTLYDHVHNLRSASKDHVQDFKGALADYEIQSCPGRVLAER